MKLTLDIDGGAVGVNCLQGGQAALEGVRGWPDDTDAATVEQKLITTFNEAVHSRCWRSGKQDAINKVSRSQINRSLYFMTESIMRLWFGRNLTFIFNRFNSCTTR